MPYVWSFTVLPAFRILLVTPLNSNTLRVFFNVEPRHQSVLSATDSLNRRLWSVAVTAGPGETPAIAGAENALPQPTAIPGEADAWSVDLRTDLRVLLSTTYEVVASPALTSLAGDAIGAAPYDRGECPGIAVARKRLPPRTSRTTEGVDLFYDTFAGTWRLDGKQDIDVHGGTDALKKRVLRRLITGRGAHRHLPGYGVGLQVKMPINTTRIAELRAEIRRQLLQEADVEEISVEASTSANGLVVQVGVVPAASPEFALSFEVAEDGGIVVG